ncbi:MAG: TolC family protein, partial [Planctomycetes bacterium]|nr:TolC family protein [Planctomycetota bacterium]
TGDKKFEYGGTLDFSWSRSDNLGNTSAEAQTYTGSNTWNVGFTQPLLKGFGKEVATYNLVQARLAEQSNLLALRDGIGTVVDSTISAFRAYAQAVRQVEISNASVERSRASLATNKLLISMGRMPANELIQTESDLANQELSYEDTLNSLDNARLALLKVLNLDQNTRIKAIEETDFSARHPDFDLCLKIAFNNRADYLNAKNALRLAEIGLVVAKNNM